MIETCAGETIDPGDLISALKLAISGEDNRKKAERSWRGKVTAFERINWPGGPPPYGYKLDRPDPTGKAKLAKEDKQAAAVLRIFYLRISGIGPSEIARILTVEGRRTYKGGRWTPSGVYQILISETYKGRPLF